MEVAAFVVAVVSAVVATVALVHAKRSADAADRSAIAAEKSAQAEERAATASEEAVAIEKDRARHEESARAEAEAPVLDAGADGNVWSLEQGQVSGVVTNSGPASAVIEAVELETLVGSIDGTFENADALLRPGEYVVPEFVWNGAPLSERMTLHVTFHAPDSPYRAVASFPLRRAGGDHAGNVLWKSAEARVTRPTDQSR